MTLAEWVQTLVPSLIAAFVAVYLKHDTKAIRREVETLNESTMGQLAAAVETRRVELVPEDERTAQEQRHLDTAPGHGPYVENPYPPET